MENLNNKFMKIAIIHRAFEDHDEVEKVAEVKVYIGADLNENISFANRVTQNIEGSWSRDKYMTNGDLMKITILGLMLLSLLKLMLMTNSGDTDQLLKAMFFF